MKRNRRKLCCVVNPYSSKGLCKPCLTRERLSYRDFKERIEDLRTLADVVTELWQVKEDCWGHNYDKNARLAYESAIQLIDDLGLEKIKIPKI